MTTIPCGTIDAWGTFYNLNAQGFTLAKSLIELVGNSIDADAQLIGFKIEDNFIYLKDDGSGMNVEKIIDMFNLNRNKSILGKKTLGKYGVGSKGAVNSISNQKGIVEIFTKEKNGDIFHIIIPIGEMYQKKQYEGMITFKKIPNSIYFPNENDSGTIYKFQYDSKLADIIRYNFRINSKLEETDEVTKIEPTDLLYIAYSPISNIKLRLDDKGTIYDWNPLPIFRNDYENYELRKEYDIEIYSSNNKDDRIFILKDCNNEYWYVKKLGSSNRYEKQPTKLEFKEYETMTRHKQLNGTLRYITISERDDRWFNWDEPKNNPLSKDENKDENNGQSKSNNPMPMDKYIQNDDLGKKFACYCKLERSGQIIGTFAFEKNCSINNSRSSKESFNLNMRIQTSLSFQIGQCNDYILDNMFSTQSNKSSFNSSNIEKIKPLTRLLEFKKDLHHKYLSKEYQVRINELYPNTIINQSNSISAIQESVSDENTQPLQSLEADNSNNSEDSKSLEFVAENVSNINSEVEIFDNEQLPELSISEKTIEFVAENESNINSEVVILDTHQLHEPSIAEEIIEKDIQPIEVIVRKHTQKKLKKKDAIDILTQIYQYPESIDTLKEIICLILGKGGDELTISVLNTSKLTPEILYEMIIDGWNYKNYDDNAEIIGGSKLYEYYTEINKVLDT